MGFDKYKKSIVIVGAVLFALTFAVFLYETYAYSGDHIISGEFMGTRNNGKNPVLCYIEISDDNMIWIPLNGMSDELIKEYMGKVVLIHYSQTVSGRCNLLSISEVV